MKLASLIRTTLLFFTLSLNAAPWVGSNDYTLRNDIQLLADTGIIKVPVTTYPVMWNAIMPDIRSANLTQLNNAQLNAINNLTYHFNLATKSHQTKIQAYASNRDRRFTSFGHNNFDKRLFTISHQYISENFAGNLQLNYRPSVNEHGQINQGNQYTLDGSYLSYKLGNWRLTAGALNRWWGPGLDTSLILSTNARPLPAINLTRERNDAFETPLLSWLGPWTLTMQMASPESDRHIKNSLLWNLRSTIRPFQQLELGFAWTLQWAGSGQPNSAKDFFGAITGQVDCANGNKTCDSSNYTAKGNQIAGYDFRWSDTLLNIPYAIYGQTIGEDRSPDGLITDKGFLYGIETRFTLAEQRFLINLEHNDTQVECDNNGGDSLNCFYEHGDYQSGYRYYRRAIGSTYDNDARTSVLTVLSQFQNGNAIQVKLRNAKLNFDDIDRFPNTPNMGNTVSKIAEKLWQIDSQYRFKHRQTQMTIGLLYTNSTSTHEKYSTFNYYLKIEYGL